MCPPGTGSRRNGTPMSYSWGAACPLLSTFHPRLAGSRPPYPVLPSIKGGRASARDLPGGQGWASGVPGVPEMSGKCVCSPGLFLEAVPFIGFSKNIVSPKGWVCVLCSRHPQAAPRGVLAAPPGLGPAWVLPPVTRAFPARGSARAGVKGGLRGEGPGSWHVQSSGACHYWGKMLFVLEGPGGGRGGRWGSV